MTAGISCINIASDVHYGKNTPVCIRFIIIAIISIEFIAKV